MTEGQDGAERGHRLRLGEYLRSRRERLAAEPDEARTPRRRTAGLRREEVACRAGISTEWYVKLEQGRGAAPSITTLNGIARALRLDERERRHLLAMAGRPEAAAGQARTVPDTLRAIVAGLAEPAYVTDRDWTVVAWNRAATDLLQVDFAGLPAEDRNILVWMLTDDGARSLFGDGWEDEARRMISLFRTTCDLHGDQPALPRLASRLDAASPFFRTWWRRHDIGVPRSGTKRLHHRTLGEVEVVFSTFQANDDPGLKLALYLVPPPARASAA